jgi:hypothetical protein
MCRQHRSHYNHRLRGLDRRQGRSRHSEMYKEPTVLGWIYCKYGNSITRDPHAHLNALNNNSIIQILLCFKSKPKNSNGSPFLHTFHPSQTLFQLLSSFLMFRPILLQPLHPRNRHEKQRHRPHLWPFRPHRRIRINPHLLQQM